MTMKQTSIWLAILFSGNGVVSLAQGSLQSSYKIASYQYWFDTNEIIINGGDYANGKISLDVNALDEGFHTLHFQTITDKGELSPTSSVCFYRLLDTNHQNKDYTIKSVQYWFDDKANNPKQAAYASGTTTLDLSEMEEGFHVLHYQTITDKGELSPTRSVAFYRLLPNSISQKDYAVKSVQYWFDDKANNPKQAAYASGTTTLDLSEMEEGFHVLHYQTITDKGELSPTRSVAFYRLLPNSINQKDYAIKSVQYWFDDKVNNPKQAAYASGTTTLDLSEMEEGFHVLHYQTITDKGELSPTRSVAFYRLLPNSINQKDYAVKSVQYWFDNDETTRAEATYKSGVIALNLSQLKEGEHTMHYQVVTNTGEVSPTQTTTIDRHIYDIYISNTTQYTQEIINAETLLQSKPDLKLHYNAANIEKRGHLTLAEGSTLSLAKFVQTANWGSIVGNKKYTANGADYYHPTTLINKGFMRADSVIVKQQLGADRWYFVSLPFNTDVSKIGMPSGTYWALRTYDGAQRALGYMDNTWVNLQENETMNAHKGYIIQLTNEANDKHIELTFRANNDTKKNDIFTADSVSIPLEEHLSEFAHNRSWNLIGNPYPSFFDTQYIESKGTITVWNGNGYSAYSLADDHYVLMPFEAFFIQKPIDSNAVWFDTQGRLNTAEEAQTTALANKRIRRKQDEERKLFNFVLRDNNDVETDRTRIVLNEQATLAYETSRDAAKFMEEKPRVAQLYSVNGGVKYAINERPINDGLAVLSVVIPQSGTYTLQLENCDDKEVMLFDTKTGNKRILDHDGYSFDADAGEYSGRFIVSFDGNITDAAQINATDEGEIKVVGNALSFNFIKPKDIKVYAADGRLYYRNHTAKSGKITLDSGVYIVSINGVTTKIMIQ